MNLRFWMRCCDARASSTLLGKVEQDKAEAGRGHCPDQDLQVFGVYRNKQFRVGASGCVGGDEHEL